MERMGERGGKGLISRVRWTERRDREVGRDW